jgi:hypothetical protein
MKTILVRFLVGIGLVMSCVAGENEIIIVNAAGLSDQLVAAIRCHAERELCVPVVACKIETLRDGDLKSIGRKAVTLKATNDVCLIVLAERGEDALVHAVIMTNEATVVINVAALNSVNEVIFIRRLQRWTLRGAAFLMGIGPDPDIHCVMHDYVTLQDLDKMGLNFSPPWGDRFKQAASLRGLVVRPQHRSHPLKSSDRDYQSPGTVPARL